jgi:hypothetical protein
MILNKKIMVTTLFFLNLSGCSTTADLFPISGPLRDLKPTPVLTATVENITSNTGPFKISYPNGDNCEGKWSSIAPQMASSGWGTMFSKYGSVVGVSSSVANLPGVNKGEAMAICNSGNQLQVEFYTGSGTANGTGVAKDSSGNVFKVLF